MIYFHIFVSPLTLFELGGWGGHYPTEACSNPNISNTLIMDVQSLCKALK